MKREYLITAPERLWHWINAALFVALALTGLLMHASENFPRVSLGGLIAIHNAAALLFVMNYLLWLAYQVATRRIFHYLKVENDIVGRLINQSRFYLFGIFKGEPHPYPVSAESKFNPLQRVTYLGLMFGLVPLQIVSGTVMLGYTLKVEWLMDVPRFRTIALVHTALSYLLMSFLAGHLYLATTGETPLALVRTMLTGWGERGDGPDTGE